MNVQETCTKCFEIANAAEVLQDQALSETNCEGLRLIQAMLQLYERDLHRINTNSDEDIEDIKEYVLDIIYEGYRMVIIRKNELEGNL